MDFTFTVCFTFQLSVMNSSVLLSIVICVESGLVMVTVTVSVGCEVSLTVYRSPLDEPSRGRTSSSVGM